MAGGETLMQPFLNETVLGGKSAPYDMGALNALLAGDQHNVPVAGNELPGSQNLWKLKAACRMRIAALNGQSLPSLESEVIARLKRERDIIGLWGSEGTSPIYHLFMLVGDLVMWMNARSQELKDLIVEATASFMFYARKMGLEQHAHGLVGQRGAGLDHSEGYPYLHFLLQYGLRGLPADYKSISGWKRHLLESGLVKSAIESPLAKRYWEQVFRVMQQPGFTPWRLRALTSILYTPTQHIASVVEKGINGNTPLLAAYIRPVGTYLPINYKEHIRQRADHAVCVFTPNEAARTITFRYEGLYADIDKEGMPYQEVVIEVPSMEDVLVFESSLDGVRERKLVESAAPEPPVPPTPQPPKPVKPSKPTWIERMGL